MAELRNPSFEDPGASFGQAEHWTEAQENPATVDDPGLGVAALQPGAEEIADFWTELGWRPYEAFDSGWDWNENAISAFAEANLDYALFEGGHLPYESFDHTWSAPWGSGPPWNHQSITSLLGNLESALFNAGADAMEGFEESWEANETAVAFFPNPLTGLPAGGGTLGVALFDAATEDYEDFEENWDANETAVTYFPEPITGLPGGGGTVSLALFTGPANYEDFGGAWTTTLP